MKSAVFIATLGLLSASNAQKNDIGCFRPGACINSFEVGRSLTATAQACLLECNTVAACAEWSYFEASSECVLFASCNTFSETICTDCLSGDKECDGLQCFIEGQQCQGTNLGTTTNVETWQDCNSLCLENDACTWFTYNLDSLNGLSCSLYSNCLTLQDCPTCLTSQRFCGEFILFTVCNCPYSRP